MIGPDEKILLDFTGREIITLLAVIVLVGVTIFQRIKYRAWNWLAIILALILLSPWPIFWIIKWSIER